MRGHGDQQEFRFAYVIIYPAAPAIFRPNSAHSSSWEPEPFASAMLFQSTFDWGWLPFAEMEWRLTLAVVASHRRSRRQLGVGEACGGPVARLADRQQETVLLRSAGNDVLRLPELAAELIALEVGVLMQSALARRGHHDQGKTGNRVARKTYRTKDQARDRCVRLHGEVLQSAMPYLRMSLLPI